MGARQASPQPLSESPVYNFTIGKNPLNYFLTFIQSCAAQNASAFHECFLIRYPPFEYEESYQIQ